MDLIPNCSAEFVKCDESMSYACFLNVKPENLVFSDIEKLIPDCHGFTLTIIDISDISEDICLAQVGCCCELSVIFPLYR